MKNPLRIFSRKAHDATDEALSGALRKLDATLMRTCVRTPLAVSANSPQNVVIFHTLAAICEYRKTVGMRIACVHAKHEAAGHEPVCNEQQCPFARGIAE